MNRRSTNFVPAFAGALCLLMVASHAAAQNSYEGYPVFWGKRDALKRQAGGPTTDAEPVLVRRTRSSSKPVKQVAYTETRTKSGVVFEASSPETMIEGDVIHEGEMIVGDGYGDCNSCGGAGCNTCGPYGNGCLEGALRGIFQRSEFSFGVQGYKGPLDDADNGNFGIHQGFNLGFPLLPTYGIGAQVGATFTQSDLSGYTVQSFDSRDSRNQQFLTVGLFERATDCCPWQWGVVFDYMSDDIGGGDDIELRQLRGELGYLYSDTSEIGFWFTTSDDNDQKYYSGGKGHFNAYVEPTDLYAFYYRHVSCEGNELRVWGGATGNSDGIVGGDFQVPISDRLALRGAANYLIPNEAKGYEGSREESWGLGVSLVWYPGCRARCVSTDLYAPLLRAADNSTFMVDNLNSDR